MRTNRRSVLKLAIGAVVLLTVATIVTKPNGAVFPPQDEIRKKTFVLYPNGGTTVTLRHNIGHRWKLEGPLGLVSGDKKLPETDCIYVGDQDSVTFKFDQPRYGKYKVTLSWRETGWLTDIHEVGPTD